MAGREVCGEETPWERRLGLLSVSWRRRDDGETFEGVGVSQVGIWSQWGSGRRGRGTLREKGRFTAAWVAEEEDADGALLVCFLHLGWTLKIGRWHPLF